MGIWGHGDRGMQSEDISFEGQHMGGHKDNRKGMTGYMKNHKTLICYLNGSCTVNCLRKCSQQNSIQRSDIIASAIGGDMVSSQFFCTSPLLLLS